LGQDPDLQDCRQDLACHRELQRLRRRDEACRASRRNKAKATTNLLEALRDRARKSSGGEIKPETKVFIAADMWLKAIDESDKAARTKEEYRRTWDRYLASSVGQLRVHQVMTVNWVITAVRDRHGRDAAAHVKVVLSGHDALADNPVRDIESLGKRKRKRERMVNGKTIGKVLGVFHGSQDAARADLVDMVDVLSGFGCRIGELLALDWTGIDRSTSRRAPSPSTER
jgi:integrase